MATKEKEHSEGFKGHNLYAVLGVKPEATDAEIKAAYRKLARKYHPDREGGDAVKMGEINSAYNVLSNAEARKRYDETGLAAPERMPEHVKLFLALIDAVLHDEGNIVVNASRKLHNAIEDMGKALKNQRKHLRELEKRRDAVKGPLPNLILEVVEGHMNEVRESITEIEGKIPVLEKMLRMLNDYSSTEKDVPPKEREPDMMELLAGALGGRGGVFRMG